MNNSSLGMFRNRLKIAYVLLTLSAMLSCTTQSGSTIVDKQTRGSISVSIMKSNAHSTAPILYTVRVQSENTKTNIEVLRATHLSEINITWVNDNTVTIVIPCGRILHYVNFVDVLDLDKREIESTIEVRLANAGLCN